MRAVLISICTLVLLLTVGFAAVSGGLAAFTAPAKPNKTEFVRSLESLKQRGIALAMDKKMSQAAKAFLEGYERSRQAGNEEYAARFLINLANVRFKLRHYRRAMRTYLQAEKLANATKNRELQATLLANISWLYTVMGAYPEAMTAIEKAIGMLPAAGRSSHLARMLAQKATLHSRMGEISQAEEVLGRAFREADRSGDVRAQIGMLEAFGRDLIEYGELERADATLTEAFRLRRWNGGQVDDSCYRNLAQLRLAQHRTAEAGRLIRLAFRAARQGENTAPLWSLYFVRGNIAEAEGDRRGALADYRAALRGIRELRLDLLPADAIRMSAGVGLTGVYDALIRTASDLYFETGRPRYARLGWETAEDHRAAALREGLYEAAHRRNHLPAGYWETIEELNEAETALFRSNTPAARRRVARLHRRLTELEYRRGLQDPALPQAPADVSLGAIQQRLRPDEVLLSFHLAEPESFLWAVTAGRIELHRLPPRSRIQERARSFREATEHSTGDAKVLGRDLYAELFGKLSDCVLNKRNWALLLDGVLFEIPFPALVAPAGPGRTAFLVEEHSLRSIPSAGMMLTDGGGSWSGPLLAVGDPVYNTADPRWTRPVFRKASLWTRVESALGVAESGEGADSSFELARLAGSARETRACARQVRFSRPRFLMGRHANLRELRSALRCRPSVIHLATHIVPAPDDPRAARIALSLRPDGAPEMLGPALISALDVRAGLVVMSGCGSGKGRILPGEGLLGLSRAWLRAGAGSVAATLWQTPDESGALLQSFYRSLAGAEAGRKIRPSYEALRLAQLEMLDSASWKSRPAYWAAYFLVTRN